MNRLHLFVEVVLALALFHLLFDTRANALLNLQQIHLRFHHGHQEHDSLGDLRQLENFLLIFDLERHVRRHGIGQAGGIINRRDRCQHFRRDLLIELDVALKLTDGRADEDFFLLLGNRDRFTQASLANEETSLFGELFQFGALRTFNQNLDGTVRKLQQLKNVGNGAHTVEVIKRGFICSSLFLGHQQNALFLLHGRFQAAN